MKNFCLAIFLFVSVIFQHLSFAEEIINCAGLENPYDEAARPWCKNPRSTKKLTDVELEKLGMDHTNFDRQSMAVDRYISTPLKRQAGIGIFAYSPTHWGKRPLWNKKTIPFIIKKDAEEARENIINALCWWQSTTEIKFYESKAADEAIEFEWGEVSKDGTKEKCDATTTRLALMQGKPMNRIRLARCNGSSSIGALPGRETQIEPAFVEATAHEIGHSLGLAHEHQRPDRDEFIKVNHSLLVEIFGKIFSSDVNRHLPFPWDELEKPQGFSEKKLDSWPFKYDYASIMHYDPELLKFKVIGNNPYPRLQVGFPGCVSEMDANAIIYLYREIQQ